MNSHLISTLGRRRGSILAVVVIITAVALVFVGSIMRWALTERKLTVRHALVLESRNAAEALAEYGFSQIRDKYQTRGTANLNPSGQDALRMPPVAFWSNSHVDGTKLELVGGTTTVRKTGDSSYYYVDPANPNNKNDPLKGKWVWRRDVTVIAKATVSHPTGPDIVSYASQSLSVRGAPLFAHAVFFNMDMEIAPGPTMNIYGPVHANGDLYLAQQTEANSLNFHGQVTASGHLKHEWKHPSSDGKGGTKNTETLGNGKVQFVNGDGDLVSMRSQNKVNGQYEWYDSYMNTNPKVLSSEFREFAANTWNGNVLTKDHGIQDYKPVAIGEYREADPYNPSVALNDPTLEPSNSGRLIIEPTAYPDPTDPNYSTKMEIEAQKYANDAGIYIKVTPPTTLDGDATVQVFSRSKTDPTKQKPLSLPAGNNIVTYGKYRAQSTRNVIQTSRTHVNVETRVQNGKTQYRWTPQITTTTTPQTITHGTVGQSTTTGAPVASVTTAAPTNWSNSSTPPNNTVTNSATNPTTPAITADNAGIFDQRRGTGVDLIHVDIDGLRKAVGVMAGSSAVPLSNGTNTNVSASDGIGNLAPSDWTGIVYVEVEGGPSTDAITGATNNGSGSLANAAKVAAVRIFNGKGKVPSYGTANEGLTIATNAPMYVEGNYNTNGVITTGSSNHSASKPEAGEVPAALVADAITILSEGFNYSTSMSANKPASKGSVEISAALLMGITPSNPTQGTRGMSSGGVHNFPRFLESWGHRNYIRGSLVALFESRVAVEPWSTDYYSPPTRNWGFNELFAEGRFPPGTPRVMSYRRVDFTNLDDASYQAKRSSFNW